MCVCSGLGGSVWTLTDSDCQLVSSALCVLSELPSICSPEGMTKTHIVGMSSCEPNARLNPGRAENALYLNIVCWSHQDVMLWLVNFCWLSVLLQAVCPSSPQSSTWCWESSESWSTSPAHTLVYTHTKNHTNISFRQVSALALHAREAELPLSFPSCLRVYSQDFLKILHTKVL